MGEKVITRISPGSGGRMLDQRIGFIGAGQMALGLARGFLKAGLTAADRLLASDVDPDARRRFFEATGTPVTGDNCLVASRSDVLFLATKPQQIGGVAAEVSAKLADDRLIVSIAAGVRLGALAGWFGPRRLIRIMPNAPCLIGQGASAYCLNQYATAEDGAIIDRLLRAVGSAWCVEEKLMDAVTGLASSGPAFAAVMIEALGDGGVKMGLPRAMATEMAARALGGAAEMILSGEHPARLKDRIASPGGTTIAGLHAMESGAVRAALIAAVEAATRRSIELGEKTKEEG
jgi:pyrroline-5-carboxylate reductase